MNKKEFESYLIREGWQDIKYVPSKYEILHDEYLKTGGSGIYEKGAISFLRLKLLKTSVRLEIRSVGRYKWKKVGLMYYEDLIFDSKSGSLKFLNF